MANETIRIEIPIHIGDNTEPGISQATRKINAFDKANQKTLERLDKMNRTKYQVAIDALDKASGVVQRIGTTVKGLTGKAWRITMKAVDLATAPIRGIINLLKNPIFQIAAITGITFGLKDTIDTFASFEATMSKVKAISGATIDEFEALNAKAKEMGATTKFTASEAGEAFTYMAMAGWDAEKMLGGISGIMSIAAADGLDLATTSDIVTDALTAFNMKAEESGHFADVLATASSSANTNVSMLGESFKYVAPLAGAMKYSVEDVSMALGLMANASVKGSMAGTSLKTALANLASPTDSMAKVMQKYGITLTETDGSMKSLRDVIGNIRTSFGRLKETEQAAAASTLFGKEAMAGMLAIINASQEDYDKLAEAIDNADGAAGRMAATMLDNLSGAFTLLQSAAEGVKITIGERLKPHIMSFTTWLTDKMPGIERAAGRAMDFVDNKVKWLTGTINDFTSGKDWEDADIWGKIRIAWDKIIAEPFAEWWSATGERWFEEKTGMIGEGIGTGITAGVLALLGIDAKGAAGDGFSIGASFAEGFSEGFDGKKVGEAILGAIKGVFRNAGTIFPGGEKASSTSWLSAAAIGLALSRLGVFKLIGKGGRGLMDILKGKGSKDGMPKGSGGGLFSDTFSTSVMHVSATAVYISGPTMGSGNMPKFNSTPTPMPQLPGGGTRPQLPGGGSTLALPGAAAAGKGYTVYAPAGKGAQLVMGTTGSALTAALANTGYALGSGASTIGGAAVAGAAGIAGGIVGGAALISAVIDLRKSLKAEDENESRAYRSSAGWKAGGVTAGALIGTAILPGLGTAVGAGIGGVAGWIKGNSEVKKGMKRAEEARALLIEQERALLIEQEQEKYSSQELKKAVQQLADEEITAEQFMAMKQVEIAAGIEERFGSVKLAMTDIQSIAEKITFGDMKNGITAFSEASARANGELEQLKGTANNLEMLNWKAKLGLAFTDSKEYKRGVDSFVAEAKQYLESRQFEITSGTKLLLGDKSDLTELNALFATIQSDIDAMGKELTAKFKVEGELDTEGIANLQNEIMEKINKLTSAEYEGSLDILKIRFGGDNLSLESFEQLQSELEKNAQAAKEGVQKAYSTAFAGLELQLSEKLIDDATYQNRFSELEEAYKIEMSGVDQRISDFLTEEIGEKFGLSAGQLTSGMQESMKQGISLVEWTAQQANTFLGLSSLEDSAGAQLAAMVNRLAKGLPDLWGTPTPKGGIMTKPHMGMVAEDGPKRIADVVDITRYQSVGRLPTVKAYAKGGILTRPHMGIVAEDGAESIIPLSPSKRSRGIDLWQQTGELLGVKPYAAGGIIGTLAGAGAGALAEVGTLSPTIAITGALIGARFGAFRDQAITSRLYEKFRSIDHWRKAGEHLGVKQYEESGIVDDEPTAIPTAGPVAPLGGGATNITVNNRIEPNLTFEIRTNADPEEIVAVIKSRTKDFTDGIGDEIAERLVRVFANMPVKGGARA